MTHATHLTSEEHSFEPTGRLSSRTPLKVPTAWTPKAHLLKHLLKKWDDGHSLVSQICSTWFDGNNCRVILVHINNFIYNKELVENIILVKSHVCLSSVVILSHPTGISHGPMIVPKSLLATSVNIFVFKPIVFARATTVVQTVLQEMLCKLINKNTMKIQPVIQWQYGYLIVHQCRTSGRDLEVSAALQALHPSIRWTAPLARTSSLPLAHELCQHRF